MLVRARTIALVRAKVFDESESESKSERKSASDSASKIASKSASKSEQEQERVKVFWRERKQRFLS